MKGNRVKLTAGRIADFQCQPGKSQTLFWDSEAPGLAVRVTANGAKSYVFETRLAGKTARFTIGDVRTWALDGPAGSTQTARAQANRLKALVDQGIDPRKEAAAREAEAAAADAEAKARELLVADAWHAYLEFQRDKMKRAHIERGKKWGERHLLDHERMASPGGEKRKRSNAETKPGALYPLLRKRMADVSVTVLKDWQRAEAAVRPTKARQAFEAFRAFWRWCGQRPEYAAIINPGAVESKELRDEVPGRKTRPADVLEAEQLPAWFAEVSKLNPVPSAYLRIDLLTGARREELAALQWTDVDFRWRRIRLNDKVDGERVVPMTPYVESLLRDLKKRNDTRPPQERILHGKVIRNDLENWEPSPWVFSSQTSANGRIQEPREAHNRALAAAGLPHVTLHGLRRSFATLAEWQAEIPTGVVAQIMGHKPSATAEKYYKRRPLEMLREWHAKYEAWILERAGIEFASPEDGLREVKSTAAA